MKKYLLFFITAAVFISCDVRRKDKIADDITERQEKIQKEELKKHEAATKDSLQRIATLMKDPTTVQLIDSVYDFGTVTDGQLVEHSFSFRNTGTMPLVVQDAHASCGCTVPEKPQQPIKPGETGVIKVVFNTKGKGGGHQEKTITVNSNARPEFGDLKIVGTVQKVQ
jgi:hypothetical protein